MGAVDIMMRLSSIVGLLSLPALCWACSSGPGPVQAPAPAGTLHHTISIQVTSSSKSSMLFNSAAFAEMMSAPSRAELREERFELSGVQAASHVVAHVKGAGRGSRTVRFFCEIEVLVYADWPGYLQASRNSRQDERGRIVGMTPVLTKSLRLENKRRAKLSEDRELEEGARFCAEGLASELAILRDGIPRAPNSS